MSWYDEEFYREPSEFEEKIDELKETIANSIRDEIKNEMERLRTENAQLQEIKSNWDAIQQEYTRKHRALENEKQTLERTIRHERLQTLLADFRIIMWRVDWESKRGPKCEECDDNRFIHFSSPSGRDMTESCECAKGFRVWSPQEYIVSEYATQSHGQELNVWYKKSRYEDSDHELLDSSTFCKVVFEDGMKFEDLNRIDTFFKTSEECQTYCDYLNAKEREATTNAL